MLVRHIHHHQLSIVKLPDFPNFKLVRDVGLGIVRDVQVIPMHHPSQQARSGGLQADLPLLKHPSVKDFCAVPLEVRITLVLLDPRVLDCQPVQRVIL